MIGVNERDLANAAHGLPEKCHSLWKSAWHKAADLDCYTGDEKPLEKVECGNLNTGDLLIWIKSVQAPHKSQSKQVFAANQANLNLLARFVKTTESKLSDVDKAIR